MRVMKRKKRNMTGLYQEYVELQDTKRTQDTFPSKYEYDADKRFSKSNRRDKLGILHLESSCYIANQVSWDDDEKRPNPISREKKYIIVEESKIPNKEMI